MIYTHKRMKYDSSFGESRKGHVAEKISTLNQPVKHIASEEIIYIDPDESITTLIDIITEEGITGVPIVENEKLIGIITKSDIFSYLHSLWSKDQPLNIQTILSPDFEDYKDLNNIVKSIVREEIKKINKITYVDLITVHVKKQKAQFRNLPLIHIKLRIKAKDETVIVDEEGWGVEYTLANAFEIAERIFLKTKDRYQNYKDQFLAKMNWE